jgi:hypothetical protein
MAEPGGLGDLLDLPALAQGEPRRAALVLGVERAQPVSVEVLDRIPDPVRAR